MSLPLATPVVVAPREPMDPTATHCRAHRALLPAARRASESYRCSVRHPRAPALPPVDLATGEERRHALGRHPREPLPQQSTLRSRRPPRANRTERESASLDPHQSRFSRLATPRHMRPNGLDAWSSTVSKGSLKTRAVECQALTDSGVNWFRPPSTPRALRPPSHGPVSLPEAASSLSGAYQSPS